jgi:hypothetical protein
MKNQMWMMLICCLAPLLLVILGPALGFNNGNAFFVILIGAVLLCFFMVKGRSGKGGCCGGHKHEDGDKDNKGEKKQGHQGCH